MTPLDDTPDAPPRPRPGRLAQAGNSGYTTLFAGSIEPDDRPDAINALYERVLHGLRCL